MKIKIDSAITLIIFLFIMLLFSVIKLTAQPLNGTYTIGSGQDYNTITEAVNDLYLKGVSGPVEFGIFSGNYNEQINLDGQITGSSAVNTVSFNAAPNVNVNYTASNTTDNFVLRISEAQYLSFKDINFTANGTDYATVVKLENDCTNLTFNSNNFNGYAIPNSSAINGIEQGNFVCSDNSQMLNLNLVNNTFNYGSYGIHLDLNNNNTSREIVISGDSVKNSFYDNIILKNISYPKVSDNYLSTTWPYSLTLINCYENFIIDANYIVGGRLHLNGCVGISSNRGTIKNNFIASNHNGITILSSEYIDIYFNSTNIFDGTNVNSYALSLEGTTDNVNIKNNILNNLRDGYAIYWDNGTNIDSDYNNLFTSGPNIGYADGVGRAELSDFSAVTLTDDSSKSATITFTSNTDLHTLNSSEPLNGIAISNITTDIDGDTRNNPPSIGADELKIYFGNVELTTQTEVDSFGALGYIMITGLLYIRDETTSISDLTPLSSLTSIGDDLVIYYNHALASLDGLNNLTSVGGDLDIRDNDVLTNLDGLSNINETYDLTIRDNDVLINLDGLSNLTSCLGTLYIADNLTLTNVDGLSNIITNFYEILILNNNALTNIDGLGGYRTYIEKDVRIENNDALINIDSLNLGSVFENLRIKNNDALTNINCLNRLGVVYGTLEISGNDALTTINGFDILERVSLSLFIHTNPALENMNGFSTLETILDGLVVRNNDAMVNIDGLSNLTIAGRVEFTDNTNLNSYCGLNALITPGIVGDGIDGTYTVTGNRYNPALIDLEDGNCEGFITLSLKIFLEGPFNSNNMNSGLTLPTNSPYDGTTAVSIPTNAVDWVYVRLRDQNDETIIIASQSAFLIEDGSIVNITDGGALQFSSPPDEYYLEVQHRNHLCVMSNAPVDFTN